MKTKIILSVLAMAAVVVSGCGKYEAIAPIGQSNFFTGMYNPDSHVRQVKCTKHEEGVECGDYTSEDFLSMDWHWTRGRLDSVVYYDIRVNTPGPFAIRFQYDSLGRPVQVEDDLSFACTLTYEGKHLTDIDMSEGTTGIGYRFHYNGSDYPDSITYSYIGCFANTMDTYRLRWRNGNLMAAVSGPDNDRYAIDSITYSYDNIENPFCGLVYPQAIIAYGIVDAPTFVSRNNLLSVTLHSHDGEGTYQSNTFQYQYEGNRPTTLIHQYENGFWCHVTDTYTLKY